MYLCIFEKKNAIFPLKEWEVIHLSKGNKKCIFESMLC